MTSNSDAPDRSYLNGPASHGTAYGPTRYRSEYAPPYAEALPPRVVPHPPSPPLRALGRQRPLSSFLPPLNDDQKDECDGAVMALIRTELQPLATKLAAENGRLFDQFDRLSAEASLRLSLAPALSALILVIAWRVSGWCLLALAVAGVLELQGYVRARSANGILAQAVVSKVIQSASIENAAQGIARPFDNKEKGEPVSPRKKGKGY